jgi:hypothetical protein
MSQTRLVDAAHSRGRQERCAESVVRAAMNRLGKAGAVLLAPALVKMTKLTSLDLSCMHIASAAIECGSRVVEFFGLSRRLSAEWVMCGTARFCLRAVYEGPDWLQTVVSERRGWRC